MRHFLLFFVSLALVQPGPAFSSCVDMDQVVRDKSVVLVEIVKLPYSVNLKRVAEAPIFDGGVRVSMPAEVKVLKVLKGSERLAGVTSATVKLRCGDGQFDIACDVINQSNYPFIEGQQFLLFTNDGSFSFSISAGEACDYRTYCVESGQGLDRCGAWQDLENSFSHYWELK